MPNNNAKGMDDPDRFINHYKCPDCGTEWEDISPYTNNDRCPICDTETSPYMSDDLPTEIPEGVE